MGVFSQYYKLNFFKIGKPHPESKKDTESQELFDWSANVREEMIESLVVDYHESGRASTFEFTVRDPEYKLLDQVDMVKEAVKVSIVAGSWEDHREIFQCGFITQIEPEWTDDGDVKIKITGQDASITMTLPPKAPRTFQDHTLAQIVQKVAYDRGFDVNLVDPVGWANMKVAETQSADECDRAFLDRLARRFGFRFSVSYGIVNFVAVQKDEKGVEKAPVTREFFYQSGEDTNLLKAKVKIKKLTSRGGVPYGAGSQSATMGMDKGETSKVGLIVGMARHPVQTLAVAVKEELLKPNQTGQAKEFADKSSELEATLVYGDILLLPGANCAVRGIGKTYSGEWHISHVRHSFGKSGFRTSFTGTRGVIPGIDTQAQGDMLGTDRR